jgi:hypothetical protein
MATDPFGPGEAGNDFTPDYEGTISSITFKIGQYGDLEAEIFTTYPEPRPKNDGTLSIGRPEFIKVAGAGQGFTVTDDGASFTHPDGKNHRSNSAWGLFLERLTELNGGERVNPIGLTVKWDREGEGESYTMPVDDGEVPKWMINQVREGAAWVEKGGKGGPRSTDDPAPGDLFHGKKKGKMIPVEILGKGGSNGATAKDFDLQALRDAGMDAVMEGRLADAAKGGAPGDFLANAVAIDGVAANKAVTAALASPEFYATLRAQ